MIGGVAEGSGEEVIVGGTVAVGDCVGETVVGEQLPITQAAKKARMMRFVIMTLFSHQYSILRLFFNVIFFINFVKSNTLCYTSPNVHASTNIRQKAF